ncbi:hypothetical protein D3C77_251830 [compost metagenome]
MILVTIQTRDLLDVRPEHVELSTGLGELMEGEAQINSTGVFVCTVRQVDFVELIQDEELHIRKVRTLDDALLGEEIDVGCVGHCFLTGVRDQIETLETLDQAATSFVDQCNGRNDHDYFLESSLCQYRVNYEAFSNACGCTEHHVATLHDQTENVGLQMMKHHTLFNTFNPVRLISQAVRKRHVVEVRRDVGE